MPCLARLARNLFGGWGRLSRAFPETLLDAIAQAVQHGESGHLGEVCFAVESRLPWRDALTGTSSTQRARDVFARLGVWDTEHRSGVLVYVLLAERRIEIVADRGIACRVPASVWQDICAALQASCARGEWRDGSLHAVESIHALLREHFPAGGRANPDELGNRPVLL